MRWCGQNYYPESLWRLYLINAPTVFRAIWACVKPTIHPETLAKTFILGGKNDYLPIFQREGLTLANTPQALGGTSAGLTSRQFVSNARAMAVAARKVYPSVAAKDLLRIAAVNLPSGVTDSVGAAAELERRFQEQGPAAEGSFVMPHEPDMTPVSSGGVDSGPPSARRGSSDVPQRMAELRGNIMATLNRHRSADGEDNTSGRSSPTRASRDHKGGFGLIGSSPKESNRTDADGSPRAAADTAAHGGSSLPVSNGAPGNAAVAANGFHSDTPQVDVAAAASAAARAREHSARLARHENRSGPAKLFFCCCPMAGCGGLNDVDAGDETPAGAVHRRMLTRVPEESSSQVGKGNGGLPASSAAAVDDEDDSNLVFYDVRENFSVYPLPDDIARLNEMDGNVSE